MCEFNEVETMDARSAISQMQSTVLRELSDLHRDNRDKDEVIVSQQKLIKMMRESVEYANDLKMSAFYRADMSLCWMILAFIVAFIAIGYAVWVS